jgi:hypothetical protein
MNRYVNVDFVDHPVIFGYLESIHWGNTYSEDEQVPYDALMESEFTRLNPHLTVDVNALDLSAVYTHSVMNYIRPQIDNSDVTSEQLVQLKCKIREEIIRDNAELFIGLINVDFLNTDEMKTLFKEVVNTQKFDDMRVRVKQVMEKMPMFAGHQVRVPFVEWSNFYNYMCTNDAPNEFAKKEMERDMIYANSAVFSD